MGWGFKCLEMVTLFLLVVTELVMIAGMGEAGVIPKKRGDVFLVDVWTEIKKFLV